MSALTLTLPGSLDVSVLEVEAAESVSAPFVLSITARSTDPSLPLAAIIGQPASFKAVSGVVHTMDLGTRAWSGIVRNAELAAGVSVGAGGAGLSTYRFELVPRLWLLSQRRGYRVFQHLSIPDIVDKLLGEWKIPPTWRIDRARYPKLEYKIQYNESDLDLVSRLLEEAGIAYVFEGDAAQGSRLVLGDRLQGNTLRSGPALPFVDNPNAAAEMEFVTSVKWAREVRPGARTLRDADFRNPARALFQNAEPVKGVESRLEQYDYDPGAFLIENGKGGDTPIADDKGIARYDSPYGAERATAHLQAMRTGARAVLLETNAYDLAPGAVFAIDGHPHSALPASAKLLATTTAFAAQSQGEWKLRVAAVPADAQFRPALRTPKPEIHGFQSATVVGPAGQEIHTDEFGRVRVQFPWDREGKMNDGASCWVRVHEGWGGLGYGMIATPRIGHEVLVTFLGGDPDQPIILGRAYNAVEQVPYKLPNHKTRSTWKTDSSLGSGGFNEIMFEDLKGQELVWEQAQKDRVRLVKNDETATIGHDRQITVKNDLEERTLGFRKRYVGKDADLVVKKDQRERIEGESHLHVAGDENERVDGSQSLTVLDDLTEEVGGRYALRAGQQIHMVAGDDIVGEAQDVTVKGPGGFLRIDSAGVTIQGVLVKINNGGSPGVGVGSKPEDPHNPPDLHETAKSDAKPVTEERTPKKLVEAGCEIKSIEVACEHDGKRKFKVVLPANPKAKAPTNVLEVVAAGANAAEKIKTTIVVAKARCATHKPKALTVTGPTTAITKAEDVSTVEVFHGDHDVHARLFDFLWPWKEAPVQWTFVGGACHGPSSPVVVRVYPAAEPSLSLEFQLDTDDRVTSKIEKAQGAGRVEKRGRPAYTAWKLEFKGKVKYGPRVVELGAKFDDKIKKLAAVNRLVKRAIDLFCEYFFKFTGVTILPVFPKLSLAYEGKFKEIEESYRVGAEWSILFKADPLIGITAKLDILDVFISALSKTQFAVIARGLDKIRKWAKDKGQTFEVTLAFTGQIGGEVGAKKNAKALKAGAYGAIEGKVKVEFGAKASFGSKGIIGFELGAEVKADTGLSAKISLDNDDKGVFLNGKMTLLACKFKYAAWASGKVIWEIKESYEGEHTFWEDIDFLKSPDVYLLKK